MNFNEVRNLFPFLKTGKIYMNHAAISPLSDYVMNEINKYFEIRSVGEIEPFFINQSKYLDTKLKLANLINSPADRISWQQNVTASLNILAQSLQWKNGDRIILNDLEFPANVYPFLNLEKKGVKIDFVKNKDGVIDPETIKKMITPETKLLSISQVQFLSGFKADLETIGKLCKEKDVIFCVDAIQGVGAVEIDVKKYNIDFLAGGTQKWLMGLQGLGYLYITEELQARLDPVFAGWLSVNNAWNLLDYDLDLRQDAERFQLGTINNAAIVALYGSLSLMEELGHININNRIIENSLYFTDRLNEIGFESVLKEYNKFNIAGIISIRHSNAELLFEKLKKNNIEASLREGILRFSPHYYNTKEEIEEVLRVLKTNN